MSERVRERTGLPVPPRASPESSAPLTGVLKDDFVHVCENPGLRYPGSRVPWAFSLLGPSRASALLTRLGVAGDARVLPPGALP